jgi:radical SAM/Cys-rich protein
MSSSQQTHTTPRRSLHARRLPLAEADRQRMQLDQLDMSRDFDEAMTNEGLWPLQATTIDVLQINVGKLCNQTCRHCHVDAGPDRTEVMSRQTAEECIEALRRHAIPSVDITGGAPELNPNFRWLVEQCASLGRHVINRCNLTILETGANKDLPEFFAEHRVELVCSLPHYQPTCTDVQRGAGVFEKSIRALRRLNALGYGDGRSGLRLVLVTNPVGAVLPASQASLEAEWKRELARLYDISFDALYTITNMPISRYLEWLLESGNLEGYMRRLVESFNPQAADGLMCRNTVSVGWDGRLYDCDFNQMLDIPVSEEAPRHIRDFDRAALEARAIQTSRHCFGCTAGAGSSCTGATDGSESQPCSML